MLKSRETDNIKRIQVNDLCNCFSFWDFEYNIEKRIRIENEMIAETRQIYAYISEGKYVAGMSLQQLENNVVYLSYLVVKEDCRNQGIGTEMIEYACQLCKKNRNLYLMLSVDKDNSGAENLYRKLGFTKTEVNNDNRIEMIKYLF